MMYESITRTIENIRRAASERAQLAYLADIHSRTAFEGFIWVVPYEQAHAMTREDIDWLDRQWKFVERW